LAKAGESDSPVPEDVRCRVEKTIPQTLNTDGDAERLSDEQCEPGECLPLDSKNDFQQSNTVQERLHDTKLHTNESCHTPIEPAQPVAESDTSSPQSSFMPVIQYNIIFDDQDQQKNWYSFIRWLKKKYTDQPTVGARLDCWLKTQPLSE
jgi:hypothetical protein